MPSCSPNSITEGNDTGVMREDQPEVGPIRHRTKCPWQKRERERPGNRNNALWRSTYGYFRFVNFGHVPPLVFSAEYRKFMEIDKSRMVQFLPLGLQIPENHPDRNRYL
jgi:hypothetical protein